MPVHVVSDSCHYLPRALVSENAIHEVSLYVHRSGRAERESDLTDYNAYYSELRNAAELPTTSQPSIGDFLAVYEPILRDPQAAIVSIHLAGGMSGTVRAAEQAREALGKAGERVRIVDSATACGGEGLMLLAAAAATAHGAGVEEVEERARQARASLKLWFAIDTLEYLRRGGRIAGAQAWLGTALRIKPILSVESEITPVERVRTWRRAFERLVGLFETCRVVGKKRVASRKRRRLRAAHQLLLDAWTSSAGFGAVVTALLLAASRPCASAPSAGRSDPVRCCTCALVANCGEAGALPYLQRVAGNRCARHALATEHLRLAHDAGLERPAFRAAEGAWLPSLLRRRGITPDPKPILKRLGAFVRG
jgi:DegV family protein with EDD domain